MRAKILLKKGETLQEAEDKLEKALKRKKECSHGEQYCDPALNEFHDMVDSEHKTLIDKIINEVKVEVQRHAGWHSNSG